MDCFWVFGHGELNINNISLDFISQSYHFTHHAEEKGLQYNESNTTISYGSRASEARSETG